MNSFYASMLANMLHKNMVIIALVPASCDTVKYALNTIEHWILFMLLCHACNLVEMKSSRARFKKLVQLGKMSSAVQCVQLYSHLDYLLTVCCTLYHCLPVCVVLCVHVASNFCSTSSSYSLIHSMFILHCCCKAWFLLWLLLTVINVDCIRIAKRIVLAALSFLKSSNGKILIRLHATNSQLCDLKVIMWSLSWIAWSWSHSMIMVLVCHWSWYGKSRVCFEVAGPVTSKQTHAGITL